MQFKQIKSIDQNNILKIEWQTIFAIFNYLTSNWL